MPKNNNKKVNLYERVTRVETIVEDIQNEIKSIKNNHLTNIYSKLEEIQKSLYERPSWLISGLIALLIGLITYLLTR